jgi:GNAT superfamily N-acetyltransferase
MVTSKARRLTPRRATPADLQQFSHFDCGDEDYQRSLVSFLLHDALDQAAHRYSTTYLFYDDASRPLAFVTLACSALDPWDIDDGHDNIPVLMIEVLAVDRSNQHHGVGSEIMAWIRRKVDAMGIGCRYLALYCDERNTRAQEFYRRQGFFDTEITDLRSGERLWLCPL